eukprot:COSAG05_NODE_155_length_15704_cov_84.777315_2_plen_35_part_00
MSIDIFNLNSFLLAAAACMAGEADVDTVWVHCVL